MSLPKSSTAVSSQHADTRLMSWSTRITSAPMCSGMLRITRPEMLGLLVGQPGGGLVEQDDARLADDRAGDLHQAALARAERPDPGPGSMSSPTNRARPARPRAASRGSSAECSCTIATLS